MPFDPSDPESYAAAPSTAPDPSTFAPGGGGNRSSDYSLASQGLAILGGLLKGMAAVQSAGYNADLARGNAKIASEAAGDAILRGRLAAQAQLLRGGALASRQKVGFAASGVDVNSGSAVNAVEGMRTMSTLDAMIAENNAAKEAWGLRTRGDQFQQQANIDEAQGMNELTDSILGSARGAASYALQLR